MKRSALEGIRVLIAEDSWHVALALKMTVENEGGVVVGPVPTVKQALDRLAIDQIDVALVDVNLRDELAFPLIKALEERGVTCVVLSGYAEIGEMRAKTAAILGKPVQPDDLVRALIQALAKRRSGEPK